MNMERSGTVGYELRREVRDALPPGLLTQQERNVLLELADDANDDTRLGFPSREKLGPLVDLKPRAVKDTLLSVWAKWIDIRVVLRLDKHGKPVYAFKGHAAEYLFPQDLVKAFVDAVEARALIAAWRDQFDGDLTAGGPFGGGEISAPSEPEGACISGPSDGTEGGGSPDPFGSQRGLNSRSKGAGISGAKGSEIPARGVGNSDPLPLSSPHFTPHLSPQESGLAVDTAEPLPVSVRLLFDLGATGDEIADVIDWIAEHHVVRNDGWWLTASANGTLADRLADARQALARTSAKRSSRPTRFAPEHCGECNPSTRLIFLDTDTQTRRCPDCHPDAPRKDQR